MESLPSELIILICVRLEKFRDIAHLSMANKYINNSIWKEPFYCDAKNIFGTGTYHLTILRYFALSRSVLLGYVDSVFDTLPHFFPQYMHLLHPVISIILLFESACYRGNLALLKYLFLKYSDVVSRNDPNEYFREACKNGKLDVAIWLINIFPHIDMQFENNCIFCVAYTNGHLNIVNWLLEKVPSIIQNVNCMKLLEGACHNNKLDMLKFLFKLFPTIHTKDIVGTIPSMLLFFAQNNTKHFDCIHWLLEKFPEIIDSAKQLLDTNKIITELPIFLMCNVEFVLLFLKIFPNINIHNGNGVLFRDVCQSTRQFDTKKQIIVLLLERYPEITAQNYFLECLIDGRNDKQITELLISKAPQDLVTCKLDKIINSFMNAGNIDVSLWLLQNFNKMNDIHFLQKLFEVSHAKSNISWKLIKTIQINFPEFLEGYYNNDFLEILCWSNTPKGIKWLHETYPEKTDLQTKHNILFRIACENGYLSLAKFLQPHCHRILNDICIHSLFYQSCLYGHLDMALWLLDTYEPYIDMSHAQHMADIFKHAIMCDNILFAQGIYINCPQLTKYIQADTIINSLCENRTNNNGLLRWMLSVLKLTDPIRVIEKLKATSLNNIKILLEYFNCGKITKIQRGSVTIIY